MAAEVSPSESTSGHERAMTSASRRVSEERRCRNQLVPGRPSRTGLVERRPRPARDSSCCQRSLKASTLQYPVSSFATSLLRQR